MVSRAIASLLVGALFTLALPTPRIAWTYSARQSNADDALSLGVDGQNNAYILVAYGATSSNRDLMLRKLNSSGRLLWTRFLVSPGAGPDTGTIAVDRVGNVYVAAGSAGARGAGKEAVLTKFDPNGKQLWRAIYNGIPNGDDIYTSVAFDAAGNLLVSGTTFRQSSLDDLMVRKISSRTGAALWSRVYEHGGIDESRRPIQDRQGHVIVGGTSRDATFVEKLNGSTGQRMWSRIAVESDSNSSADEAFVVGVDSANNVIHASGVSFGLFGSRAASISKFRGSDGHRLWGPKEFDESPEPFTRPYSGAVDVAGNSLLHFSFWYDVARIGYESFVKLDPLGNVIWERRHNDASGVRMLVDGRGNLWSAFLQGASIRKVRYSPTGDLVYSLRLPLGRATGLARDFSGAMLILGTNGPNHRLVRLIGG